MIKVLEQLGFSDIVDGAEPLSEAGKELIRNYRSFLFNNDATCNVVNQFVSEASKYAYDPGVAQTLEKVTDYLSENRISWQLASACENFNTQNNAFGYVAKTGIEKVRTLLEMGEYDVISYIKSGALKGVQYIPEFRSICRQVINEQVAEKNCYNYSLSHPVSYVITNESGDIFFQVNHNNYKICEGRVEKIGHIDNETYNYINAIIENFKREGNTLVYEYKNSFGEQVRYEILDESITITKGLKKSQTFESRVDMMEFVNMLSKTMPTNEKLDFLNKAAAVATVFENSANIAVLDNVRVIQTQQGFAGAIIEGADNVNLTVYRSKAGKASKNFDFIIEAIQEVTSLSGVDLTYEYNKRISEDCTKQNDTEAQQMYEQVAATKKAEMDVRKKKIAMLAESYKNDPVKLALLNSISRDIKALE